MKKYMITLLVGMIIGGGVVWYSMNDRAASRDGMDQTGARIIKDVKARGAVAREILSAKMQALDLQTEAVRAEMRQTGTVVRRKAREFGRAVADAAVDARITTEIKAKLVGDSELSAWDISVSTSEGRVTLSGEVTSTEQVAKAILLAYETSGVREVVSTLRIKSDG